MNCKNYQVRSVGLHVLSRFLGMGPGMTLRSVYDLEVICAPPILLHAKLYGPMDHGSRVTCYAYILFT